MKITAKDTAYSFFGLIVLVAVTMGVAVLDIQLIVILIAIVYAVYFVLTKATSIFSRRLLIIRYERVFFLIVVLNIAILQITIKGSDPSIPILLMVLNLVAMGYLIFTWIYEKTLTIRALKTEKLEAELMLLKQQINPHFFFNTLNNLYGLALEKSDQTPKVIHKLSEMMRYVIYEGAKNTVSVGSEIDYMKNYVDLQRMRYKQKPKINYDIDLKGEDIDIAPLLLTNLIENAFKHGVHSLEKEAFINIAIRSETDKIRVVIENNYVEKSKEGLAGIGLANLKRRLVLLYPDQHELRLEKAESVYTASLIITFR